MRSVLARRKRGERLGQFSRRAGIGSTTLFRWKRGGPVDTAVALRVCERLRIPHGPGTKLLSPSVDTGDVESLRSTARAARKADPVLTTALLVRAGSIVLLEVLALGTSCGMAVFPDARVFVERVVAGSRRAVEITAVENDLMYILEEGPSGAERLCGCGSLSKTGIRYCKEFLVTLLDAPAAPPPLDPVRQLERFNG